MNRRSLLALLGLAPAAVALPALARAVEVRHTHPIVIVPNVQCAKCGSTVRFHDAPREAVLKAFRNQDPYTASCHECGVTMRVPLVYAQCAVIEPPMEV